MRILLNKNLLSIPNPICHLRVLAGGHTGGRLVKTWKIENGMESGAGGGGGEARGSHAMISSHGIVHEFHSQGLPHHTESRFHL